VSTTVTLAGAGGQVVTNYLVDVALGVSQVVAESDGTGALGAYYVRNGSELVGVRRTPVLACYLRDGLGSVRGLTDAGGNVTDTFIHSAFGETLARTGSDPQPFGFAGEAFEPTTGLSYNRARWMEPRTGRFLTYDHGPPTGYAYANSSPVSFVDPSGYFFLNVGEISAAQLVQGALFAMNAYGFVSSGKRSVEAGFRFWGWVQQDQFHDATLSLAESLLHAGAAAMNVMGIRATRPPPAGPSLGFVSTAEGMTFLWVNPLAREWALNALGPGVAAIAPTLLSKHLEGKYEVREPDGTIVEEGEGMSGTGLAKADGGPGLPYGWGPLLQNASHFEKNTLFSLLLKGKLRPGMMVTLRAAAAACSRNGFSCTKFMTDFAKQTGVTIEYTNTETGLTLRFDP
jgi:RHS repeat-associated protein